MSAEQAEQRALAIYVDRAHQLAECVKLDIQKKGYISNKTVLALNQFTIAANNIADLLTGLDKINQELN